MDHPALIKIKGGREDRVRAAPAVSRAKCGNKNAHEHTGSAEASGLPCAMVLRLIPRSPRRPGLFATFASRGFTRNLTPASGRQDHTALPSASARFVKSRLRVHRIPPRVRDVRNAPLW